MARAIRWIEGASQVLLLPFVIAIMNGCMLVFQPWSTFVQEQAQR
jgi:hypothetical protein